MPEGAQYIGAPLFQKEEMTVCPSKSRNRVAGAPGKLFSIGRLNAFGGMKLTIVIRISVKKVFIIHGFRVRVRYNCITVN